MNQRWYFDRKRGLVAIRRSPDARDYPTVEEVKAWVTNGSMSQPFDDGDELDRCPTCGRASECVCPGCDCWAAMRTGKT